MNKLIIVIFLFFNGVALAQSLGKDRIEKLNKTVVRILIEDNVSGTGFFVSKEGWIATCNHVIQPAFIRNKQTLVITNLKPIYAEFQDGERVEVSILSSQIKDGYKESLGYDFILLKPIDSKEREFDFLKLGKWDDVEDGDEVYSCGYPRGIQQRFISKGLFSTKYVDPIVLRNNNKPIDTLLRDVAWIDLTLNPGNSGGPIIKMGKKPKNDIVIGLASYILNPNGNTSAELSKIYRNLNKTKKIPPNVFTNESAFSMLFGEMSKNSIGVSGVISIDYISEKLLRLNP